ncbi:MAG: Mur ligase family protein, partial [Anderseniella sp.]
MNKWQKLQIQYYRIERLFTRPVRNMLYRRLWRKNLPVAMITGSHGKTTTSLMLANILKHAGHCVGLACSEGVF